MCADKDGSHNQEERNERDGEDLEQRVIICTMEPERKLTKGIAEAKQEEIPQAAGRVVLLASHGPPWQCFAS